MMETNNCVKRASRVIVENIVQYKFYILRDGINGQKIQFEEYPSLIN